MINCLLPLGGGVDDDPSTESEDDSVKVVLNVDEDDSEMIDLTMHLAIENGPEGRFGIDGAVDYSSPPSYLNSRSPFADSRNITMM